MPHLCLDWVIACSKSRLSGRMCWFTHKQAQKESKGQRVVFISSKRKHPPAASNLRQHLVLSEDHCPVSTLCRSSLDGQRAGEKMRQSEEEATYTRVYSFLKSTMLFLKACWSSKATEDRHMHGAFSLHSALMLTIISCAFSVNSA